MPHESLYMWRSLRWAYVSITVFSLLFAFYAHGTQCVMGVSKHHQNALRCTQWNKINFEHQAKESSQGERHSVFSTVHYIVLYELHCCIHGTGSHANMLPIFVVVVVLTKLCTIPRWVTKPKNANGIWTINGWPTLYINTHASQHIHTYIHTYIIYSVSSWITKMNFLFLRPKIRSTHTWETCCRTGISWCLLHVISMVLRLSKPHT